LISYCKNGQNCLYWGTKPNLQIVKVFLSLPMRLFAFIVLLLTCELAHAQLNYTFQQVTQTYQPLTAATVLSSATTDSAGGALTSLNSYVGVLPAGTIPFGFIYNGISYTGLAVSSNGFLTFGSTNPSTTNVQPISSTALYSGAISAFGRDLIGVYRVANPADPDTIARIRYQTLGSFPQRVFVVEWANFRPTGTAPSGLGPVMSFQIQLFEGSNKVEIVYGSYVGGTWPNSTAQVGIRGASNTAYQNRLLTSGQAWTLSTAGTASNSSCAYTGSTLPVSGLTFRFNPPCQTPSSLSVVDLLANSVTLRWGSGISSGAPGASYQVEWGPSGFTLGTGTSVSVTADSTLSLSGLTAGTSYAYYVRRNCDGAFSNWAGPKVFTPGLAGESCVSAILASIAISQAACAPTAVSNGQSQNGPNAICSDALGGNTPDDDVWYKFTGPASGKALMVRTTAGTNSDWVMEVWKGCPGSGGILVGCSDDVNAGMPEISICQNLYQPGDVFYVRLWTYSLGATGTCSLCVYENGLCIIPPTYDNCDNAATIPINPVLSCPGNELNFTTQFATPSGVGGSNGAAPSCDGTANLNDVWLTFNTGTTGDFKITFALGTATALRAQLLFECGGGGFEIQCFSSAVGTFTFTGLNPSADYVLRIWSPTGQEGTFTVCAQDLCDDATAVISGSATICPGGSAQLRVDLTGLSPWTVSYSDGSTTSSFTTSTTPYFLSVTPTTTSFYNLVSVNSSLCFGSVSGVGSVTVNPPPTVTLTAFANPICSNSAITLSGGSPSGGTYSGTGVTGNQFNAAIAGVGTHTITYTFGTGSGCLRSDSKIVTVISGPKINSFSPASGPVGTLVSIVGTGFSSVSSVRFNSTNASSFNLVSSAQVTATVPSGATTGLITVVNSNGCSGQSTGNFQLTTSSIQLSIRVFVEAMYAGNNSLNAGVDAATHPNLADSVTVMLRQSAAPHNLVSTQKVSLSTSGFVNLTYPGSLANQAYYIVVKTRNSIETWSKIPVNLLAGSNQFNFTGVSGSLRVSGSGGNYLEDRPEHPE
jgi:hypothetical protein